MLQLDRDQRCFTLDINQEFDVRDAKPAIATTYDYHKTVKYYYKPSDHMCSVMLQSAVVLTKVLL